MQTDRGLKADEMKALIRVLANRRSVTKDCMHTSALSSYSKIRNASSAIHATR